MTRKTFELVTRSASVIHIGEMLVDVHAAV